MSYTAEQLIAFEARVAELWRAGELPFLFHLAGGNERTLINIFQSIRAEDYVFASHRSHYHHLLHEGKEETLLAEIMAGRSMFLFDKRMNFLSSSVLGGVCGIAAGVALAISMNRRDLRTVHRFVGDGAADNGHLYEALRFCQSRELPIQLYIEDNGRSCDSSKRRRGADEDVFAKTSYLHHYGYVPTYPHCQAPAEGKIEFKREVQRA